jgi:hypothetical protein
MAGLNTPRANPAEDAALSREIRTRRQRDAPRRSTHLVTAFRTSFPTLIAQGVKQQEPVALPDRTQQMDQASVVL